MKKFDKDSSVSFMSFNAKKSIRRLIKKANLSNCVAVQALKDAKTAIDNEDYKLADRHLSLVLTQIAHGRCLIDPSQWKPFCTLYVYVKEMNLE